MNVVRRVACSARLLLFLLLLVVPQTLTPAALASDTPVSSMPALASTSTRIVAGCPKRCLCRANRKGEILVKLKKNAKKLTSPTQFLQFQKSVAKNVVIINLEDNLLKKIPSLKKFPKLRKLSLKNNGVRYLASDTFAFNLKLTQVILKGNNIKKIDKDSFSHNKRLKTIDLSENPIKTFPEGLFDKNSKLLALSLSELKCDCTTAWFSDWLAEPENVGVLQSSPKCSNHPFTGQLFVSIKDFGCVKSHINISPHINQVVFVGDSLHFVCNIEKQKSDPDGKLVWHLTHNNGQINKHIPANISTTKKLLSSEILIQSLNIKDHFGIWKCSYENGKGIQVKSPSPKQVTITVLKPSSKFCAPQSLDNDKGIFNWTKTLSGETISIECPKTLSSGVLDKVGFAKRNCTSEGWGPVDDEDCEFTRELSSLLKKYLQDDRSNVSGLLMKAEYLCKYIEFVEFTSHDLDLLADVVEMFVNRAHFYKQFISVSLTLIDIIYKSEEFLLKMAEKKNFVCSRIIRQSINLSSLLSIDKTVSKTTQKSVNSKSMTITTLYIPSSMINESLSCVLINDKVSEDCFNSDLQYDSNSYKNAETQLFKLIFTVKANLSDHVDIAKGITIGVLMMNNNILFNSIEHSFYDHLLSIKFDNRIYASLIDISLVSNSEYFTLQQQTVYQKDGVLSLNPCKSVDTSSPFNCSFLPSTLHSATIIAYSKKSRPFHILTSWWSSLTSTTTAIPILATCLTLMVICLLISLVYLECRSVLTMPRCSRHSLVNYSLTLTCFLMSFDLLPRQLSLGGVSGGVLCAAVGICGHFFSLCMFSWTTMNVFSLYSVFTDAIYGRTIRRDENGVQLKVPVLGLYLFGFGIPAVISILTISIDKHNYISSNHVQYTCMLQPQAYIYSMAAPVALFTLVAMVILVILVCLLYRDNNKNAQVHHQLNGSLSLIDRKEVNLLADKSQIVVKYDREYSPRMQVCGVLILVCLNLLFWMSAVLTLTPDSGTSKSTFSTYVYSTIFVCFACILGSFLLIYFLLLRGDIRMAVMQCLCCRPRVKGHDGRMTSSSHSYSSPKQLGGDHLPPSNQPSNQPSDASSDHHGNRGSLVDFQFRVYDNNDGVPQSKLNNSSLEPSLYRKERSPTPPIFELQSDVNELSPISRPQYVASECGGMPTNNGMIFYNAKQNGVARKYYQKSRRAATRKVLTMKNNTQSDCETADMFKPQKSLNNEFNLIRNNNSPFNEHSRGYGEVVSPAPSSPRHRHGNDDDANVNICSTTEPVDVTDDDDDHTRPGFKGFKDYYDLRNHAHDRLKDDGKGQGEEQDEVKESNLDRVAGAGDSSHYREHLHGNVDARPPLPSNSERDNYDRENAMNSLRRSTANFNNHSADVSFANVCKVKRETDAAR